MVQTDKTDSKPEGGGGENGNATGNSQQQQPQPIQPLPSYGVPVMMGGGVPTMMGPMGASPMMMGDMMAMMAMGGGHPGGSFAPLVGGGGPPAPLGPGYPPNMPAWMTPPNHGGVDDEGGTSDGAVYGDAAGGGVAGGNAAGDGEAAGAKGKKSKKEAYKEERKSALASRIMKRRRTSPYEKGAGGKNAKEEPFEDVHVELMSESWKKEVLEKLPRCKAAEGIRETSYYSATPKGRSKVASTAAGGGTGRGRYGYRGAGAASAAGVGASSNIGCLRKLLSELNRMEYEDAEQLPGGTAPIWVRYDDECPQYMRALITGPPRDTPYSNGLFAFDIFVPNSYPAVAPEVQLLTTGGGTVGFGPNLYRNGKVCLSLLNTWSGPKWDPGRSSILQILVSIQGLILGVEHPYYMEGYGGWEGSHSKQAALMHHGPAAAGSGTSKNGAGGSGGQGYIPTNVRRYEDNIRAATMKYAIAEYCRDIRRSKSSGPTTSRLNYLSAFETIVRAHFWHRKECILADAKKWVHMAYSHSQKKLMQGALKSLESALGQLEEPESSAPDAAAAVSLSSSGSPAAEEKDAPDSGKPPAAGTGASSASPETDAKRREMEAAAAKGDYIAAGRIQAQLELSAKVDDMIAARKKEMDEAAAMKDYVEAGQLQVIVRHLESNRMRLQDLERRMFDYASKQDFVKAGRFQEQYRVLMESAEVNSVSTPAGASGTAAKSSSMVPGGLGGVITSSLMGSPPIAFGGSYALPLSGAKKPTGMTGIMADGTPDYYFDDYEGDYPDDYDDDFY